MSFVITLIWIRFISYFYKFNWIGSRSWIAQGKRLPVRPKKLRPLPRPEPPERPSTQARRPWRANPNPLSLHPNRRRSRQIWKSSRKVCRIIKARFSFNSIELSVWHSFYDFSYTCYSARRFIGSQIIESAAYCNQIMLVPLYLNSTQNTLVNWIIRWLLSLLGWPKVILLSGGHCIAIC